MLEAKCNDVCDIILTLHWGLRMLNYSQIIDEPSLLDRLTYIKSNCLII